MYKNNFTQEGIESSLQFRYQLESLIETAAEICERLALIRDLDTLIRQAAQLIQKTLGYDQVIFYLLDPKQPSLKFKSIVTATPEDVVRSYTISKIPDNVYKALKERHTIHQVDPVKMPPPNDQPEASNSHSVLIIPVEFEDTVFGILRLNSSANNMFNEADTVFVLKALATRIAGFIQYLSRSNLYAEVDNQQEELHLNRVSVQEILPNIQQLTGLGREMFDKIVLGVIKGLGYTGAVLNVLEKEGRELLVKAIAFDKLSHHKNWDMVEQLFEIQIVGKSVSLLSDRNNLGVQTCLTGDVTFTNNLYDLFTPIITPKISSYIQESMGINTFISIPLLVGKQVVGNLFVGAERLQITQTDLDALQFYVTNAAIAVQNSTLFEHVNQKLILRETELAQLRSIERTINSSLDLREVLKRILNGALDLTGAVYGRVVLKGKYASDLVHQVSFPEVLDSLTEKNFGITQAVVLNKKPRIMDRLSPSDEADFYSENMMALDQDPFSKIMSSLLGVPIMLEDELIGVINIASQKTNAFDQQSIGLLEQLAVQAAIAIKNAYQFKVEQDIRERFANMSQVVAMADMAGNMVHSINNQVGSIRADINYLKQRRAQNKLSHDELTELLDDMLKNAEATLKMAENIRKPFQPLPEEAVDVSDCIQKVLREKRYDLAKVIVVEAFEEVPPVWATRQLELVFENLINNALSAMKHQLRGVLRFVTSCSSDGAWVEATVQDSGGGIPDVINPEDIFKLGVSGKKDGLGYGLWWCDTFIKRWGGQILLEDTGRGCKFIIRLPAVTTSQNDRVKIMKLKSSHQVKLTQLGLKTSPKAALNPNRLVQSNQIALGLASGFLKQKPDRGES